MAEQSRGKTSPAAWVDLRGKVALVTGAARGIGLAIAAATVYPPPPAPAGT